MLAEGGGRKDSTGSCRHTRRAAFQGSKAGGGSGECSRATGFRKCECCELWMTALVVGIRGRGDVTSENEALSHPQL